MNKKLPVNLNTGITVECWTFPRLAAIMSDEKYLPWYIEKFNYYYVNGEYIFNYCDRTSTEFLSYYDEVLTFQNIDYKKDIVQELIRLINDDGYIYISCDRFFVKGSTQYQKVHENHELLIYGYDDESREFDFIDININGVLWGEHKISFDDFNNGFKSAIDFINREDHVWNWIYQTNLPASVFYLNKNFNRGPRLEVFYHAINECLLGGETLVRSYRKGEFYYQTRRYGISIYRSFYDDLFTVLTVKRKEDNLSDNDKFEVLFRFKSLVENKYGLVFKLNYLNKIGLMSFPEETINNAKEICVLAENIFRLLTKYSYSGDKNVIIKARDALYEIENKDRKVLTEIRDLLFEQMKRRA